MGSSHNAPFHPLSHRHSIALLQLPCMHPRRGWQVVQFWPVQPAWQLHKNMKKLWKNIHFNHFCVTSNVYIFICFITQYLNISTCMCWGDHKILWQGRNDRYKWLKIYECSKWDKKHYIKYIRNIGNMNETICFLRILTYIAINTTPSWKAITLITFITATM